MAGGGKGDREAGGDVKLAVTGKGGVGKTTLVALLGREAAAHGYRVLLVDADPDANLATTLGVPEPIAPLAEERQLVAERAGADGFVRLNPAVDDIPERYTVTADGVSLLVLGGVRGGGAGCACPANTLLKALLAHLLVSEKDVVLLDMEAGIEHLGRGTVRDVDALLLIVEADRKTLETAERSVRLAHDLGIREVWAVANRVRDEAEVEAVRRRLPDGVPLIAHVPYLDALRVASYDGPLPDGRPPRAVQTLFAALESRLVRTSGSPSGDDGIPPLAQS
jgi:CO dehydrogenase maturation factor